MSVSLNMETGKALIAGGPRDHPTTRPMFPQSHAWHNVIDGRNRNMEIDTEMDTEIEIVMEIDTEIDTVTEIFMDILLLLTLQPRPSAAV